MNFRCIMLVVLLAHSVPFLLLSQKNTEFRGVWIASVANMDWPSQKGQTVEKQKEDFLKLLDFHIRNGINTVIVQVRPCSDAFYESSIEPWSEYLSGTQGKAPDPYYDPMQFMIEETHKRGMEFHVWINPYRAVFDIKKSSVDSTHITKIKPEWFINYGNVTYFNPGIPEVRGYVVEVVKDIVGRYEIDGLHMDDYFYPYPVAGEKFDDDEAYEAYGNGMKKDEWRRSNCDSIVKEIYEAICATKVGVKFGISPFGVWRNKRDDPEGSNTKAGTTCYSTLYADVLLWLKNGWVDYVIPQLYWEIGNKLADFDELANWWAKHGYGKHVYIGHGLYKYTGPNAKKYKDELPRQIKSVRKNPDLQGSCYFSCTDLVKNLNGWADSLHYNYNSVPSLIPPMPWIDSISPQPPTIEKIDSFKFLVKKNPEDSIKGYSLFSLDPLQDANFDYATFIKQIFSTDTALVDRDSLPIPNGFRLFVAAISIGNNLSDWIEVK